MSGLSETERHLLLALRRAVDPPPTIRSTQIAIKRGGSITVAPGSVTIPDDPAWTHALRELLTKGFVILKDDVDDALDITADGLAEARELLAPRL